MAKVTLDIAGFYYSIDVEVPESSTVKDVLDAAKGVPNLLGAILDYGSEGSLDTAFTVDRITITHTNGSARSRQTGASDPRTYEDGIYSFSDDGEFHSPSHRFRAKDPNKNFVHAWQYYVYDENFQDLSRKNGGNLPRKIVGYSDAGPEKGYVLKDGYTVVWRLVTIMVGPNVSTPAHIRRATAMSSS